MALNNTTIKKKVSKKNPGALIGSIAILAIVIISFVLAPAISDLASTGMDDIEMGSYGREKITYSFVRETPFKQEITSISNTVQDSADPRILITAYNRAVTKAAAIDEYNSSGYIIPGKTLDNAIINSGYYNVDGAFSVNLFKNTPESRKLEIRDNIERNLKLDSWMDHKLFQQRRSKNSLEFIARLGETKRNFNYVTYNYKNYPIDQITEYANLNKDNFKELFLSRITVNKEDTADELLAKLEKKESTFSELAKLHSVDNFKETGGVVSTKIYSYELKSVYGIEDPSIITNLKAFDKPVKIKLNNQFILLTLNKDIEEPNFSKLETIEIVRDYLLSNERGLIENYFLNKMSNTLALEDLGLEVKETGLFSINFGGEPLIPGSISSVNQDSIFARASGNENFFASLFNLEENSLSEPIVLGDSISLFKLIEEVKTPVDLTEQAYLLDNVERYLLNYKSSVEDKRFTTSSKYVNNFSKGYTEILKVTRGTN